MTILTISAAATAAGIDRRTVQRAIQSGRLSATVDATGRRGVDTSELMRVFGPLPGTPQGQAPPVASGLSPVTADPAALVDALRQQVRQLEEQLRQGQEREGRLLTLLEVEQQTRRDWEMKLLPAPSSKGKKKKRKNSEEYRCA